MARVMPTSPVRLVSAGSAMVASAAASRVAAVIRFGRATGVDYRALQSKWFGYWLKGEGDGQVAEATLFDAGTNTWTDRKSVV